MIVSVRAAGTFFAGLMLASAAFAQGMQITFGASSHDSSLPVEVTAEQLNVDQADGAAIFTGNVVAGQGEMRLSADRMQVEYTSRDSSGAGRISRLLASGGVVLVNGAEEVRAQQATYTIDAASVVMIGGVTLARGGNLLSADRMVIDLNSGDARMDGRVRSIFNPGGN